MIPVGRDCDCGYPLVWRLGEKWCAVYGSHPLPDHERHRVAGHPRYQKPGAA
jgi:hypothetical protein